MDDDFAFSLYRTRQEWEEEQERWRQFEREYEEERRRQPAEADEPAGTGIWSYSYLNPEALADLSAGQTVPVSLFGIGAHVAELITNIKEAGDDEGDAQADVDMLNRHFGNLSSVIRDGQEELIDPLVNDFCSGLMDLAIARSELTDKCLDLQTQIRTFGRSLTGDAPFEDDIPF